MAKLFWIFFRSAKLWDADWKGKQICLLPLRMVHAIRSSLRRQLFCFVLLPCNKVMEMIKLVIRKYPSKIILILLKFSFDGENYQLMELSKYSHANMELALERRKYLIWKRWSGPMVLIIHLVQGKLIIKRFIPPLILIKTDLFLFNRAKYRCCVHYWWDIC